MFQFFIQLIHILSGESLRYSDARLRNCKMKVKEKRCEKGDGIYLARPVVKSSGLSSYTPLNFPANFFLRSFISLPISVLKYSIWGPASYHRNVYRYGRKVLLKRRRTMRGEILSPSLVLSPRLTSDGSIEYSDEYPGNMALQARNWINYREHSWAAQMLQRRPVKFVRRYSPQLHGSMANLYLRPRTQSSSRYRVRLALWNVVGSCWLKRYYLHRVLKVASHFDI